MTQHTEPLKMALLRMAPPAAEPSIAQRFIADPDALMFEPPYNGTLTYMFDTDCEVEFPDGSFACCQFYIWMVGRFPGIRVIEDDGMDDPGKHGWVIDQDDGAPCCRYCAMES